MFIFETKPVGAAGDYWASRAEMPTARWGHVAAAANGKLYAISGYLTPANQTNEEYDPLTNKWSTKAPIPTPRLFPAVAVWQNQIYVMGGFSSLEPQPNANEVYDPATDSWKTKSPLPKTRNGYSACTVGNRIYVIGGGWTTFDNKTGKFGVRYYDYTDVYDPVTDSWSIVAPPPKRQSHCQLLAFENKIYVLGESLIQVYDPAWPRWLPEIRTPANFSESARIVATTGMFAPKRIHIVDSSQHYIYDPENDVWTVGAPMLTFRNDFGLAEINDKLYTIGGWHRNGWWSHKNEAYNPSGYTGYLDPIPLGDTTPPSVSIFSPKNKTYNVNNVSLVFAVNEPT